MARGSAQPHAALSAHVRRSSNGNVEAALAQWARCNAYVTVRQWIEVLKRADAPLTDLLVFLKETGCSLDEALALRRVHFYAQHCFLTRSAQEGARSRRRIRLTSRASEIAERLIKQHPTGPIFRCPHDAPWSPETLARRINRLRLGFDFSPYSLQRTYITDALNRGVDTQVVARQVGRTDAVAFLSA